MAAFPLLCGPTHPTPFQFGLGRVISLTNRCLYVASLLYKARLFAAVLFFYLPIVNLIPFLHYWLEPVSKHFTVKSTPVVFGARDK